MEYHKRGMGVSVLTSRHQSCGEKQADKPYLGSSALSFVDWKGCLSLSMMVMLGLTE